MTAHNAEVKSGTDATISCVIDGITSQAIVEWVGPGVHGEDDNYTPQSGTQVGSSQTATLDVKGAAVTEDKAFACRVTSSQFPDSNEPMSVTSVQLYVYGMFEISFRSRVTVQCTFKMFFLKINPRLQKLIFKS